MQLVCTDVLTRVCVGFELNENSWYPVKGLKALFTLWAKHMIVPTGCSTDILSVPVLHCGHPDLKSNSNTNL